ncbi:MAG TPA: hypothetical protein VIU40_04640 [Geobacteraceae bacterium]
MKKHVVANRLCLSCRRACKQQAMAVVSSCPRYYPRPKIKPVVTKQLEFEF